MRQRRTKQLLMTTFFSLFISSTIYATPISAQGKFFEGSEHIASGDTVNLYFDANDKGSVGIPLEMPNGLSLSYGDIVSLGDYYELVDQPISSGKTAEERKVRFLKSFNTFAYDAKAVAEANKILDLLHDNRRVVDDAMKRGEDPEIVYASIAAESNRQLNCITGGGCASDGWWLVPGRYLKLAEVDYDHFGKNAWLSYTVGHQAALEEALRAHQTGDLNRLKMAYAMNAFACHFLTDRFAAGHMRSPRVELPAHVTPKLTGTLLVHFMHNEENRYGVHVHNAHGDKWVAYGDKAYFTEKNKRSKDILQQAMQVSALQIFHTYLSGEIPTNDAVHDLLPHPDELNNQAILDISPMFYWDANKNKLMRRVDLANPYDRRWTDDWWGWSTLILLSDLYGIPGHYQAELARSEFAKQAVKDGLITDKAILKSINR